MGRFQMAVAAAPQRASPLVAQTLRRGIFATIWHLRARGPADPPSECSGGASPPRRVEHDDRVSSPKPEGKRLGVVAVGDARISSKRLPLLLLPLLRGGP